MISGRRRHRSRWARVADICLEVKRLAGLAALVGHPLPAVILLRRSFAWSGVRFAKGATIVVRAAAGGGGAAGMAEVCEGRDVGQEFRAEFHPARRQSVRAECAQESAHRRRDGKLRVAFDIEVWKAVQGRTCSSMLKCRNRLCSTCITGRFTRRAKVQRQASRASSLCPP